ncbi:MAG: response regulator [Burkholderiales bacterium]|nr:response regulator [Burkholderiales bacterium]
MATVLIVDDDESIRALVSRQLAAAGYEVKVAEDAIEAGHMVLRAAPDLIVLDVSMPYMSGFEFAAALNADTTLPFIPIVFLTSHEDREERALALGAVGYLNKPVEGDRLVSLVRQHLA